MTRPYDNLLMTEGGLSQRYIWGNELIEADGADPLYYLQDHLGSPIRLMGSQDDLEKGTPLAYDEFGVPLVAAWNMNNPFGFAGYQAESILELYYVQARCYDPRTSRWLAEDTHWNTLNKTYGDVALKLNINSKLIPDNNAIIQSTNLYAYCVNNPLVFIDPHGQDAIYMTFSEGADFGVFGTYGHSAIAFQDSNDAWWFMSFEGRNSSKTDIPVFFYQLTNIKWNADKTMMLSGDFLVPDGNGGYNTQSYYNGTKTKEGGYVCRYECESLCDHYDYIYKAKIENDRKISIYDSQIYITGDFSKSYDKASGYAKKPPGYNLLGRNCSWLALEVLQVSTTGDVNKRIGEYLWERHYDLYDLHDLYDQYNLYDLDNYHVKRKTILPNNSVKDINKLFGQQGECE
jgi:RHS repeat-associated protein